MCYKNILTRQMVSGSIMMYTTSARCLQIQFSYTSLAWIRLRLTDAHIIILTNTCFSNNATDSGR